MGKDLPYFKFVVADWLTGDIVYEPFNVQGLFINICAIYWQRHGKLTIDDINKRFKNPPELDQLTGRFVLETGGFISVSFLDEQFTDREKLCITNKGNGKKGGRPKAAPVAGKKPSANRTLTEPKAKQSNKEKKRKEKNIYIPEEVEFLEYAKEVLGLRFQDFEFSLKGKYESWKKAKWHDGHNNPIKDWKGKLRNTIPHLKPFKVNTGAPVIHQDLN